MRSGRELGVGLVEDHHRRRSVVGRGVRGQVAEQALDQAVRFGQRRGVVRAAQPDDVGAAGGRPDPRDIHRVAALRAEARHGPDGCAALLGVHPVHRVRGGRDDGRSARRQECLRDEVEDLVGAGADESSSVPTP
jgi:hypothetical protein